MNLYLKHRNTIFIFDSSSLTRVLHLSAIIVKQNTGIFGFRPERNICRRRLRNTDASTLPPNEMHQKEAPRMSLIPCPRIKGARKTKYPNSTDKTRPANSLNYNLRLVLKRFRNPPTAEACSMKKKDSFFFIRKILKGGTDCLQTILHPCFFKAGQGCKTSLQSIDELLLWVWNIEIL